MSDAAPAELVDAPDEVRHEWTDLAEQMRAAPVRLPRARRADDQRRRVRRAAAPAGRRSRTRTPSCARPTARPRRSAATFSTDFTAVEHLERMLSLDNVFSAGRAGGLGRPGRARRRRRRLPLPLRAQDRRPGDQPALRERPAGARPPPAATAAPVRTSPSTSARSSGIPHRLAGPTTSRSWSRSAARSSSRSRRFDGAQRRRWSRRARRRSPTRATPPPARCGRRTRGSPRPAPLRMLVHGIGARRGFDITPAVARPTPLLRDWGLPVSTRVRGRRRPRRRAGVRRVLRRAPPRRRARDRRRRGQGRRGRRAAPARLDLAGRRGGRSRSSTRPRRSTPSCSTSGSTSAAPAG